jgi:glycosyltransferase involved in cell wall biosynthesis
MKVTFIVDKLGKGGISRVCLTLAKGLVRRGINVSVLTRNIEPNFLSGYPLNWKHINICKTGVKKLVNGSQSLKIITDSDIIHSHYTPLSLLGSLFHIKGYRHIYHEHGHVFTYFRKSFKSYIGFINYLFSESITLNLSDRIIFISEFIKKETSRLFPFVSLRKSSVIYNPVDDAFKRVDYKKSREILGLDSYRYVILSIENPRQNNCEYLEIFNTITRKIGDIAFVLVTRSKQGYDYLYSCFKKTNSNVILLRNIMADEQLNLLYNASDLYFTLSRWESFGYPVAEAMHVGKPVIGYDATAINELILNGFNGFKVPLGDYRKIADAIVKILEDEELRKKLGENAYFFSHKHFSLDIVTQKVLNLYGAI